MKKRMALAAATMLAGLFGAPALAQAEEAHQGAAAAPKSEGHFYAGAGINLYFIDKGDAAEGLPVVFEDQPSPGAFVGRLGYQFTPNLAVEVDAGIGGAKSKYSNSSGTVKGDIGVSSPVGADIVLSYPMGEGGSYIMGKVGYQSVTVERSLNGASAPDIDISGADFGVGAGFRSDKWDLRAEYSFMSGDASSGVLGIFALTRF